MGPYCVETDAKSSLNVGNGCSTGTCCIKT